MKIITRDVIAILTLVGGYGLIIQGFDGTVSMVLALIIGYYFSKRTEESK